LKVNLSECSNQIFESVAEIFKNFNGDRSIAKKKITYQICNNCFSAIAVELKEIEKRITVGYSDSPSGRRTMYGRSSFLQKGDRKGSMLDITEVLKPQGLARGKSMLEDLSESLIDPELGSRDPPRLTRLNTVELLLKMKEVFPELGGLNDNMLNCVISKV
jgi:hypothetical protein